MLSSKFSVIFFIGITGFLIGEVHGSGNQRGFLSKLIDGPTDDEIEAFNEHKPPSEEDIQYMKGLYNTIVSGDGSYVEQVVSKKEESPPSPFSSKLKNIITKILGNDKTAEEIEAHHEFKTTLSPRTLEQLTALYQTVSNDAVVPDGLDLWTLPYDVAETAEEQPCLEGQEEPSSSKPPKGSKKSKTVGTSKRPVTKAPLKTPLKAPAKRPMQKAPVKKAPVKKARKGLLERCFS